MRFSHLNYIFLTDFRARYSVKRNSSFEPPLQPTPSEATSASTTPPSSSQFMRAVQPMEAVNAPQYDPSYYDSPAFGVRRGKADRAQQVCRGPLKKT